MTNIATRFQPDISGSAVPTGFIGQVIDLTSNAALTFSNSGTYYNVMANSTPNIKLTLTPGIWSITGMVSFGSGSVSTGTIQALDSIISTSASTPDLVTNGLVRVPLSTASIGTAGFFIQVSRIVNISANTDYYLLSNITNSVAATTTITATTNSRIFGIRIA